MSTILMTILGIYYKSDLKDQAKAFLLFLSCDIITVIVYLMIYTDRFSGV